MKGKIAGHMLPGHTRIWWLGSVVLVTLIGAVISLAHEVLGTPVAVQPQAHTYQPLIGKSEAELGIYVREFASAMRAEKSGGIPEIVLIRPIRRNEFEDMGFAYINVPDPEPPMMLAILHGDMDSTGLGGGLSKARSAAFNRINYLGIVFDMRAGTVVAWQESPNGGRFRQALKNPDLPDDLPPGVREQAPTVIAQQTAMAQQRGVPQQAIIPTAPKPTPPYMPVPVVQQGAPNISAVQTVGVPIPPGFASRPGPRATLSGAPVDLTTR
jgi:hypothetical protein